MKSISETINLVTVLHDGQYRKKTNIPYVSHPFGVMTLLIRYGFIHESLLKTALLHDTLEDTEYTSVDLKKDFNENITDYVKYLSEDKSKSWIERKSHTISNINKIPDVAKWVLIADKVNNLEMNKIEMEANKLNWDKFNKGKVCQEWYFKSIYQELVKVKKIADHPMVHYYKTLVLFIFDGEIDDIPNIYT